MTRPTYPRAMRPGQRIVIRIDMRKRVFQPSRFKRGTSKPMTEDDREEAINHFLARGGVIKCYGVDGRQVGSYAEPFIDDSRTPGA